MIGLNGGRQKSALANNIWLLTLTYAIINRNRLGVDYTRAKALSSKIMSIDCPKDHCSALAFSDSIERAISTWVISGHMTEFYL